VWRAEPSIRDGGRIDSFLITCEHGGNRIPAPYRALFRRQQALLDSHRGYDPGALIVARSLARELEAPLISSTVSRLLIDLNRSIGHPQLYSEPTRSTSITTRQQIVERFYLPYRMRAEACVMRAVARGRRMIHISSHSFTPRLDGNTRRADIGLLYDPARPPEVELCRRWKASLEAYAPQFEVRRNYPYRGTGDGLTSYLRRRYPARSYVGIELELNQKHYLARGRNWNALRAAVIASLCHALGRVSTARANVDE
jgi:predicted N-formylglutamate amidohydrolase